MKIAIMCILIFIILILSSIGFLFWSISDIHNTMRDMADPTLNKLIVMGNPKNGKLDLNEAYFLTGMKKINTYKGGHHYEPFYEKFTDMQFAYHSAQVESSGKRYEQAVYSEGN